jgi:DHA2 family multidrug resistance protein-like MFS transporter
VLTVFVLRQSRIANPLIDLPLLRERAFAGSVGANLVTIVSVSALSLAFSQYFQDVRGWSPLSAGLALLAGPVGAMIGGPSSAAMIAWVGRARTTAIGLGLMAVSMVGFTWVGVHTAYWVIAPAVVLNGIGMGFIFGVTQDTMLATAPKERAGAAAAIGETAMELGGGLGIAVLGSVLAGAYRGGLRLPAGLPEQAATAAHQNVGSAMAAGAALPAPQGPALVSTAQQAFVHGIHVSTMIGACILAVGAVAALYALRGVPAVIEDPQSERSESEWSDSERSDSERGEEVAESPLPMAG